MFGLSTTTQACDVDADCQGGETCVNNSCPDCGQSPKSNVLFWHCTQTPGFARWTPLEQDEEFGFAIASAGPNHQWAPSGDTRVSLEAGVDRLGVSRMTEESFALAAVVTKGSDAAPSIETTVAPFATLGSTDPPWQLLDLHHDHLGSTRRVSWDGGGLSTKHDFLPFGEEIAPSQGLATKKFTGHERNQGTGLDYMLARHYGFRLPRFLSPDPVSGNLGIPDSWNAYSYVRNSPVSLVDPTGMYAINPNPTDPDWKDPCGKLGPLCSYDKEGKKLKRRAKRFIRRNAKNRAERKRLIWILENADANPHTIHVSTSGDARIKITPQGVTPSVGEDSLNPGELIATGDPKTVRALAADRQTRGSSAKVQYGEFSAELDKSTGRIVDARFTIFEGSHRVQPINVSLPLGDDVLSTFIHESAHVMGPYVLAEIQIHLYVGGTFAQ